MLNQNEKKLLMSSLMEDINLQDLDHVQSGGTNTQVFKSEEPSFFRVSKQFD